MQIDSKLLSYLEDLSCLALSDGEKTAGLRLAPRSVVSLRFER